ncbi:MAG: hypothetical protein EHM72_10020 [Calditrichaeota bacterium]|nr:MAG: hypothetical protein EHM72_10020 [Calditrichota bacterium]
MKSSYITVVFLLLGTIRLSGDVGMTFDVEHGYVSNAFSNYRQLADSYLWLEGKLYYDHSVKDHSALRFYYQPNGSLFDKFEYRNFNTHQMGIDFYSIVSNRAKIDGGMTLNSRNHSSEYRLYEYRGGQAYLSFRFLLTDQLYSYFGISSQIRDYQLLSLFSYQQHQLYWRMSKFYSGGLSLFFQADFLQKQYMHVQGSEDLSEFPDSYAAADGINYQGVILFKAAQAISPDIGVNLQFLMRKNLVNSPRYLMTDEGEYYTNDDLFDDIFGYDASMWSSNLKTRLGKMTAEITGALINKHYINRFALDLDGYPLADQQLRRDYRTVLSMSLSRTFRYSRSIAPFKLVIDFSMLKNHSNDPYYHYSNRFLGITVKQSL